MKRISALLLVLGFLVGCTERSDYRSEIDNEAVQAVMSDYIDQSTDADGRTDIRGTTVVFDYLHEDVKTKDGMYVSCADFKAESGEVYDIDYYVDSTDTGLEVERVVFHKQGDEEVNEVLWSKGS